MRRRWRRCGVAVALGVLLACAATLAYWLQRDAAVPALTAAQAQQSAAPETIARGAYLARVGNCQGCHSAPGAPVYAGGRAIDTPFGAVYAPNLTPDPATGLGQWSAEDFWQAMHHGRSKSGRWLTPAFPYPDYTHITRDDADALYAYLRSLEPVTQTTPAHTLRFPYNTALATLAWRALFFRPGDPQPQPDQSAEWNRGAYLVRGLGHCGACHTPRNMLGASMPGQWLGGSRIPMQNWYAPALNQASEAGVADWSESEIVQLLTTGVAPRASAIGPMAEVVFHSTQYLDASDAHAMAVYLRALPAPARRPVQSNASPPPSATLRNGAAVYEAHCAQCHGLSGEGVAGEVRPLAGNRAVLLHNPANLISMVLQGGYQPATAGNPRPHGMPPFAHVLSDQEIADVATYVRNQWGNQAPGIGTMDVYRAREGRKY